jgi:sulfite exporter TauE/SafE
MLTPLWLGPLAMGFAGSAHCGAMCGGIASSPVAASGDRRIALSALLHAGRLSGYAAAGAVIGSVGLALERLPVIHDVLVALRGLAGVLLLVIGAALVVRVRSFAVLDRIGAPLWRLLRPHAQRLGGPSTPLRALAFGVLWGFLPCGLVYAALGLAAASGSPLTGALTMLAFGAGTLPALVTLGSLATGARRLIARAPVRVAVGLLVAFSGVVNIGSAWPDVLGPSVLASTTHACCRARNGVAVSPAGRTGRAGEREQ